MDSSLFDFDLPEERIAQAPVEPRDAAKLLVCAAPGKLGEWTAPFRFEDRVFRDVEGMLGPGHLVVVNDAKVLPVRLFGRRLTGEAGESERIGSGPTPRGGQVEALLLRDLGGNEWSALLHLSANVRPGLKLVFEPGLVAEVLSTREERERAEGEVRLRFGGLALERIALETWLERHGHVPLPPYIRRADLAQDREEYQTVYARSAGSAAAPTAGFHFTEELLDRIAARGARVARVTLHVGLGTFRPIKADRLEDHVMHEEVFEISEEFANVYREARTAGRRVVAVGTTVVRALESWLNESGGMQPDAPSPLLGDKPGRFPTRLFIRPGHRFRAVDDLITNFHLPRSTLLVLVAAAMGGRDPAMEAYRHAIERGYRFFSYGDAMFLRGGPA